MRSVFPPKAARMHLGQALVECPSRRGRRGPKQRLAGRAGRWSEGIEAIHRELGDRAGPAPGAIAADGRTHRVDDLAARHETGFIRARETGCHVAGIDRSGYNLSLSGETFVSPRGHIGWRGPTLRFRPLR